MAADLIPFITPVKIKVQFRKPTPVYQNQSLRDW